MRLTLHVGAEFGVSELRGRYTKQAIICGEPCFGERKALCDQAGIHLCKQAIPKQEPKGVQQIWQVADTRTHVLISQPAIFLERYSIEHPVPTNSNLLHPCRGWRSLDKERMAA